MHFALSEEHLELASTVRSLLARHADSVAVRAAMVSEAGYDGRLWRLLSEEVGAAALAKAWCTTALDHVAAETVQLHGGIAITWEHDAQLLFKRANALGQLFGDAGEHRRRFGELRGLG